MTYLMMLEQWSDGDYNAVRHETRVQLVWALLFFVTDAEATWLYQDVLAMEAY